MQYITTRLAEPAAPPGRLPRGLGARAWDQGRGEGSGGAAASEGPLAGPPLPNCLRVPRGYTLPGGGDGARPVHGAERRRRPSPRAPARPSREQRKHFSSGSVGFYLELLRCNRCLPAWIFLF